MHSILPFLLAMIAAIVLLEMLACQTPGGLPDRAGGGGAADQFYSGSACD